MAMDHVSSFDEYLKRGMDLAVAEYSRLKSAFGEVGSGYCEEMASIRRKIAEVWESWMGSSNLSIGARGSKQSEVYYSAPEIGISGARIDLVENGHPVEVKAGNATGINQFHVLQLAWYTMVLEFCLGIDVDLAEVFLVRTLRREPVIIDDAVRSWAIETREEAVDTLGRGIETNVQCERRACLLADSYGRFCIN